MGRDRRLSRTYGGICGALPRHDPAGMGRGASRGITTICLSCLLEAGRYDDLIELLAGARVRWWHWHCFGAEALARREMWDAAIAYAEGCREPHGNDDPRIDRFCEDVLIKSGRPEEAYYRYGLRTVTG